MARSTKTKKKNKTEPQLPRPARTPDEIWQRNPEIIRQFLKIRPEYEQLCAEVEYILRKKIAELGIETSTIASRAKTLNSFLEKLQRKRYDSPFDQLTDLAGARVVCLYGADVAKVAAMIRAEFTIDDEVDKVDQLGPDQFGYGARHFILRLGKASSGARYDDLKTLQCEVQVRTVVQDAWAIIQHHMVYKRESQVPTQLQRKLNSLAGLFETVDDQFERIREEREAYVAEVRDSVSQPAAFLENELNLDTFKEYLKWKFPERPVETWNGQARLVLDGLVFAGSKLLRDVDGIISKTAGARAAILKDREAREHLTPKDVSLPSNEDGSLPSNLEAALALSLTAPNGVKLIPWGSAHVEKLISEHRRSDKG